jgi:HSP20 family protein
MSVKTDRWWMAALPFDRNDLSWLPLPPPAIRIEEYRSEDRYVVRAELPGVDVDRDVRLTYLHGALRLHVHRDPREAARSEFHYGSCARTIPLPAGARTDEITARYTHGILEITVPIGEPGSTATPIPVDVTDES